MKIAALIFVLISAAAVGQNELSLNNIPIQVQTSTSNDVDVYATNNDGNPSGNEMNAQVQVNTNINVNFGNQHVSNVQQKSEGIQIQAGGNRSRGAAAPSSTYTAGSGHKSYSLTKEISKKLKSFQYKHSGKKKFRRHSGRHSRGSILRCFNW